MVFVIWRDLYGCESLTPELTGAGGPTGPQGTNIGHQNREAMANVGVRVEPTVRLVENDCSIERHECYLLMFTTPPFCERKCLMPN
jgi:hypothetical protein